MPLSSIFTYAVNGWRRQLTAVDSVQADDVSENISHHNAVHGVYGVTSCDTWYSICSQSV